MSKVCAKIVTRNVIVKKLVWDCGNENHNHCDPRVADRCIAEQKKPKKSASSRFESGRRYLEYNAVAEDSAVITTASRFQKNK